MGLEAPGRKKAVLAFVAIATTWAIFILPSSFHPNWSFFDDPLTLSSAESLPSTWARSNALAGQGRYYPAYCLYYFVLFKSFGYDLTGYYVVQSLVLLATMLLIHSIVARLTGSARYGVLAAFLVITATPVAENAYTLSKAELKILFYLACGIYIFLTLIYRERVAARALRAVSWAGIAFLFFIAVLTKETSMVFLVFAITGAGAALFIHRTRRAMSRDDIKAYLALSIISVLVILFARGLYYVQIPPGATGIYVKYKVGLELVLANLRYYKTLQPDVLITGLVAAMAVAVLYKRRAGLDSRGLVFVVALFFAGLAYVAGMLLWKNALGYYLLVPAALFPVVAVTATGMLARSPGFKKASYAVIALLLLTRVYSIPYFYHVASGHKAHDKTFNEALSTYMDKARPGERLLVEESPFYGEPAWQTKILMKDIYGREHLDAEGVEDIAQNTPPPPDMVEVYGAELADRERRFPRENDYILTNVGRNQSHWHSREVRAFLDRNESLFKKGGMNLEEVDVRMSRWKGLYFSLSPYLPPGVRNYSVGYKLYRVKGLPMFWEGRWSDNWTGKRARFLARVYRQKEEFVFNGVATEHGVPNRLIVMQDGKVIKEVLIGKAGDFHLTIEASDPGGRGLVEIEFLAEKTFNPKRLGINDDTRDLGVLFFEAGRARTGA